MASEKDRTETKAEILAEMRGPNSKTIRRMSQRLHNGEWRDDFRTALKDYAERIESADKREQELWQELIDTAKKLLEHEKSEANRRVEEAACCHPTEGGNSVVLRRALEIINEASYVNGEGFPRIDCTIVPGLQRRIDAALSAPMRNCDRFATWDEAWDCWFNLPSEEIGGDYGIHHFVEWLFSPVTDEGGAK